MKDGRRVKEGLCEGWRVKEGLCEGWKESKRGGV